MNDDGIAQLREAVVLAGRRLAARGLIAAGEGNLSVRLRDGSLLITPSGLRKDELSAADLVIVAPDGTATAHGRGLRPSSDLALHRAVYAARPDVVAYAHAHIASAMALTLAGEHPDPAELPETALFIPRLPVVPLMPLGSAAAARALADALAQPPDPLPGAALMARHGAVAVGTGQPGAPAAAALGMAVDRLELVDVLCRVWLDATLLRAARDGGRGATGH
jgi:L-fuculose-phosphate aldolase